ncbi:DNA-(apurinic or apyrimidinic site) lyase [Mariprofundus ferrinatatus]|uniref:Formamidopyrimidine-DNA glycosylase n=1 Tax=Mariprofundus ferrinatatus TaxID=1921087 RepID=A0A2K8LA74_9PROT|nr:bifunctional DNA-formamidopyrimidine glycosylase/DNA-(apurinic or apyrimidinic site) lyase [Mariprofundus ferrinatatus]ATX81176.1 DNA-(apurinic or apyrimidinic site) lyase [Mariprofundus ferrinatatus]
MPELPEVETVRSGLAPLLQNRQIIRVTAYRKNLRYPLPDLSELIGRKIMGVARRSKYLLFEVEGGKTVVWHLGMTGQFHLLSQESEKGAHEHVRLDLDDGQSLRYRDARRFGYAGLLDAATLDRHPWFARLGPEPLSDSFSRDFLAASCNGRKAPIKAVIMDAATVVGVGNIYAAESLFRAGIHPARAAGRISEKRLALLAVSIKQVLLEAIEAGGSTISDFVKADGKPGYFAHRFQVYGREGAPCFRCANRVKRMVQAGRSSFYCPGCQH